MREFLRDGVRLSVAMLATAVLLSGCETDFEDNEDQRDDIVSFLESSHVPTLISESDIKLSLEDNPNFYVEFGDYAYLYIDDYYNTERDDMTQISKGSRISITFRLYPFDGDTISDSELPTYTNDPAYEADYIDAGLNTTYWSFEPLEFTVGGGNILDSIQSGLIGCREGDNIEIYMTRNMGYGDDVIGVMEQDCSLAFFCTIESVEN
ncbi:MAG: FKBP-type peptidyl-prolyl cis-trans isomerase [Rikenellaceae bacterium]